MNRVKSVMLVYLLRTGQAMLFAQSETNFMLSIEQMFELADNNSKSIKVFDIAKKEANKNISVAKNNRLPTLDVSLYASYIGN